MDLSNLSPDQLRSLKHQLDSLTDTSGRSPFRPRQLHDLTRKPQGDDPRPLFVWSAESPLDYVPNPGSKFPRLLWSSPDREGHQTEVTAHDQDEMDSYLALNYVLDPPQSVAADPFLDVQAAFEGLSEAEQEMLLQAQREDKLAALRNKLADLSDEDVQRLMSLATAPKRGKKTA